MATIVVATDGSESARRAAREAIRLAHALGDTLMAVCVLKPAFPEKSRRSTPGCSAPSPGAVSMAEAALADLIETAESAAVHAEATVRVGFPAYEICRVAEEHDARLIVIGSRGGSGMRRLVVGSVSAGVLRHAQRPVLVVPVSAAVDAPTPVTAGTTAG